MTNGVSYVLITPARNAQQLIEKTIESVIHQTILPRKWIVVDDGSTDGTESVVKSYAKTYSWIEFFSMPPREGYDLSAKARCFNTAFDRLRGSEFDFIANIDADISFDDDYFEYLLGKLRDFPEIGVAGTPMRQADYDAVEDGMFNETDVFGACQVFRRACLESIGGYLPIRRGVDWAAVRMARMKGWQTRSFMGKRFLHHRTMGATDCSVWRGMVNQGVKDYSLGNHPLWQMLRVMYQMTRKPYIIIGTLLGWGYLSAFLARIKRPIPPELIQFHRREEMERLKSIFTRILSRTRYKGGLQS